MEDDFPWSAEELADAVLVGTNQWYSGASVQRLRQCVAQVIDAVSPADLSAEELMAILAILRIARRRVLAK